MPREALPWFRFYCETIWDRKLRRLDPSHRWLWATVLACARQSAVPGVLLIAGQPMDVDDLADAANLPAPVVDDGMRAFCDLEMVIVDGGAWVVINFNKRQPADSTERSRRSRSNGVATSSQRDGDASESDQDPDTDPSLIAELVSPGIDLLAVWDQIARWNLEARQAGNGEPVHNPEGWLVRAREKAQRDYSDQVRPLVDTFVIPDSRTLAELLVGKRAKTYLERRSA